MKICRVIGTAVSTVKYENLESYKLLIVREVSLEDKLVGKPFVAIDVVGAGEGEVVLVTVGSAASAIKPGDRIPVDASIVGILDSLSEGGKLAFKK
jgi:ethanolamine utilization protein EutN